LTSAETNVPVPTRSFADWATALPGRPARFYRGGIRHAALDLKANRYDPANGTLALPAGAAESFKGLVEYWMEYFGGPERNGGLARETVSDPRELRQLTAFFGWAAWASAAMRLGTSHSDTNNFPYEPLAGNTPTAGALIYSALSLVFLLGGTAAALPHPGLARHLTPIAPQKGWASCG
jgi:hypothetical protein